MVCFTLKEGIELHVSRPAPSPLSALLVDRGPFESQDTNARHWTGHVIGECQVDRRHNTPFIMVCETCLWNGGRQTGSVASFGQNSVVADLRVISTVLEW